MTEERRPTVKFPVVKEVGLSEAPPRAEEKKPSGPPAGSVPPSGASAASLSGSMFPRQPSFIDPEWLDSDTSLTRPTETSIELPPAVSMRDRALLTVLSGLNAGQVFT